MLEPSYLKKCIFLIGTAPRRGSKSLLKLDVFKNCVLEGSRFDFGGLWSRFWRVLGCPSCPRMAPRVPNSSQNIVQNNSFWAFKFKRQKLRLWHARCCLWAWVWARFGRIWERSGKGFGEVWGFVPTSMSSKMDQKQLQAFATVRRTAKHLIFLSECKSFL